MKERWISSSACLLVHAKQSRRDQTIKACDLVPCSTSPCLRPNTDSISSKHVVCDQAASVQHTLYTSAAYATDAQDTCYAGMDSSHQDTESCASVLQRTVTARCTLHLR